MDGVYDSRAVHSIQLKTKWKKNGNDPHEAKATALKLFCENSTILVEVLRSREYDIHIYTSFNCNDKHAL